MLALMSSRAGGAEQPKVTNENTQDTVQHLRDVGKVSDTQTHTTRGGLSTERKKCDNIKKEAKNIGFPKKKLS